MGKNNNNKNFVIGSLVGGIVGAAAALFFAPKSGKEIRENLGQQANAMKDRTGRITSDAFEKGTGIANVAKEKSVSLSQVVSEQSSQIMNKVRDITSSSKGQADIVENQVGEALDQISKSSAASETDVQNNENVSDAIAEAVEAISEDEKKEPTKTEV